MRHYTALEKSQEQNYAVSRSHTSNITDDTIHVAKFQVFIFIYILNIFLGCFRYHLSAADFIQTGITCPPPTLFRPASLVRIHSFFITEKALIISIVTIAAISAPTVL